MQYFRQENIYLSKITTMIGQFTYIYIYFFPQNRIIELSPSLCHIDLQTTYIISGLSFRLDVILFWTGLNESPKWDFYQHDKSRVNS